MLEKQTPQLRWIMKHTHTHKNETKKCLKIEENIDLI